MYLLTYKPLRLIFSFAFILQAIHCSALEKRISSKKPEKIRTLASASHYKGLFFDSSCNERLRVQIKEDLSQMNVPAMTMALSNQAFKAIIPCRNVSVNEHIPCLKDLLSDNSLYFFDHIDRKVLSYMKDNLTSLRGVFIAYDQNKEHCNKYYGQGGLGFCIRYTGEECWDNRGTIGRKTIIGEGGAFCKIEKFITPDGRFIKERLIEGLNCNFE